MDSSLPGSSACGILQARILEWVAFPSPGDLLNPGIKPTSLASPALADGFFTTSATWEVYNGTLPTHKKKKKKWNFAICKIANWTGKIKDKQILYDITYMWNLKKEYKGTYLQYRNRLIDIVNSNLQLPKGKEGRINWEYGINRCILPYIK